MPDEYNPFEGVPVGALNNPPPKPKEEPREESFLSSSAIDEPDTTGFLTAPPAPPPQPAAAPSPMMSPPQPSVLGPSTLVRAPLAGQDSAFRLAPPPSAPPPPSYAPPGSPPAPQAAPWYTSPPGSTQGSMSRSSFPSPTSAFVAGPAATPAWPQPPTAQQGVPYSAPLSPYGPPAGNAQQVNTSGKITGDVPPEIDACRWNWGAFFFPFWWSAFHNCWDYAGTYAGYIALSMVRAALRGAGVYGILLHLVGLGMGVRTGFNGHLIGWRNRHFPGGVQQYFAVQRAWMIAGFIYWGLAMLATIVFYSILLSFLTGAGQSGAGSSSSDAPGSAGFSPYGGVGARGYGAGGVNPYGHHHWSGGGAGQDNSGGAYDPGASGSDNGDSSGAYGGGSSPQDSGAYGGGTAAPSTDSGGSGVSMESPGDTDRPLGFRPPN